MSDTWGMCRGHRGLWNFLVSKPRAYLKGKTDLERFEHYAVREISEDVQRTFGVKPDCWLWGGGLNPYGYGIFNSYWSDEQTDGSRYAHLFSYVNVGGNVRNVDLESDHTCRVRPCVNPSHVEQITQRENTLRGIGFSARNARKKRCDRGHAFTSENTWTDENGWRRCRECNRQDNKEYQSRPEVKAANRERRKPSTGVRGKGQYQAERDTCGEGHKLEGDNLIQEKRTRNGKVSYARRCRICVAAKARDNYAKRQKRQ